MKTSVQMYSLRFYLKEYGLDSCLKIVVDSGFDAIELVCIPDDILAFYKKVSSYSLDVSSAHIALDQLSRLDDIKELTNLFCFDKIIIPYVEPSFFHESYNQFIDMARVMQKNISKLNLKLCYHNHDFEFTDGNKLSPLISHIPGLLLEPDVFWLKTSKMQPLKFLNDHAKDIALVHLKEHNPTGGLLSPIIGEGDIGADKIIQFAKEQNHKHIVLEFEMTEIGEQNYLVKSNNYIKKYL